jgi:uncharacterized protein YnzC (UPF0291/DUF896 family)
VQNALDGLATSFLVPIRRCIECNDCYNDDTREFKEDMNLRYNYIHEVLDAPGLYGVCPRCIKREIPNTIADITSEENTTGITNTEIKTKTITRNDYIKQHGLLLDEAKKASSECRNKCWKCIDNTRVSVKSSKVEELTAKHGRGVFDKNLLIDLYKGEDERRSIYYTQPDQCTLETCETYIKKKAADREIKRETRCMKILEQINDW